MLSGRLLISLNSIAFQCTDNLKYIYSFDMTNSRPKPVSFWGYDCRLHPNLTIVASSNTVDYLQGFRSVCDPLLCVGTRWNVQIRLWVQFSSVKSEDGKVLCCTGMFKSVRRLFCLYFSISNLWQMEKKGAGDERQYNKRARWTAAVCAAVIQVVIGEATSEKPVTFLWQTVVPISQAIR